MQQRRWALPEGEAAQQCAIDPPRHWVDMVRVVRAGLSPVQCATLIAGARSRLASLTTQAAGDVLAQLADPPSAVTLEAVEEAVSALPEQFLNALADTEVTPGAAVTRLVALGVFDRSDENGNDLRRSLRIVGRHTWRLLHVAGAEVLDSTALGVLGEALLKYLGDLDRRATRALQGDSELSDHDHLVESLLSDEPPSDARWDELAADALSAGWVLPTSIVMMRVQYHGTFPSLRLPDDVLVHGASRPALIACDAADAAEVADRLRLSGAGLRIAVSLPTAPTRAAAADRWARRALHLVDAGVIPPHQVIWCRDHVTHLWLHSEPLLRRQMTQELLTPLLAESTNSREILAETMLAWLESRDSAPAIADRLQVHPQTVRYRWRRINELFGDLLHDREFVVAVTLLLKATVPLWKAGDTSDVALYLGRTAVE